MLKFVQENAPDVLGGVIIAPIITCDHCGEEITDASLANVAYRKEGLVAPPTTGEPIFLHKACHMAYDAQFGNPHHWANWSGVTEMRDWFVQLENNTHMDTAAHRARMEGHPR